MEPVTKTLTCYRIVRTQHKVGKDISEGYTFYFSVMKPPEKLPNNYYQLPHDIELHGYSEDFKIGDKLKVTVEVE